MIIAYPPTEDPVIVSLCAALNKAVAARFYVGLANAQGGSGFYAEGTTLRAAKAEARAHLRRYPSWERAIIYECQRGITTMRCATLINQSSQQS